MLARATAAAARATPRALQPRACAPLAARAAGTVPLRARAAVPSLAALPPLGGARPVPSPAGARRYQSPDAKKPADAAPELPQTDDDADDDMEDMFVDTSMGKEWGGPTRGGKMPEPTRFGDWERKGRATDF